MYIYIYGQSAEQQIPMIQWPFAWLFSSHFTVIELGRVMVKFYNVYQTYSPFSGWCVISTCVPFQFYGLAKCLIRYKMI